LQESGFLSVAQSELMYSDSTKYEIEKWEKYDRQTEKPKVENFEKKQTVSEIPFDLAEAKDTGFFCCGTSQSGKTTLSKHLAKRLIDNGISVYVLDTSRAWTEETPIENVITVPHNGNSIFVQPAKSAILDLSELGFAERIRFVNEFTKMIYRWCQSFGYKSAPFTFIIFEEAQTYFYNGSFRSTKKYSAPIDLVTVGANYNLRFGLITQFPAMVDKAPVKISQQRYFGWTTEKNDLDYIRKFIGKEHLDDIKNLRKGEFFYQLRNDIIKCKTEPFGKVKSNSKVQWQTEFSFPLVS
jgi:hypothetical protein